MTRVASNQLLALSNRLCWFIKPASVGLESTRIGSTSSLYWNGLIPYALSPDHKAVKSTSHVAYISFDPKVNSLTGQFRLQIILPTARFAQESFHQQGFLPTNRLAYGLVRPQVISPTGQFRLQVISDTGLFRLRDISDTGQFHRQVILDTGLFRQRFISGTDLFRLRVSSP